jgi:hypothetical protein
MPKANFSQFISECEGEDYRTAVQNNSITKISIETPLHDTLHNTHGNDITKNKGNSNNNNNNQMSEDHQHHQGHPENHHIKKNTFLYNVNKNVNNRNVTHYSSSNNIFLSNNKNKMSLSTNANANAVVKTNIFKNTSINQGVETQTQTIEINDETFPSLTSSTKMNAKNVTAANSVSVHDEKKIKNFKDAICSSVSNPPPSFSPKKQMHLKGQNSMNQSKLIIPPLAVKRNSEMTVKKVLSKTNHISHYDEEDDDDYDGNIYNFSGTRQKSVFVKRHFNSDEDESDD